MQHMSKLFCGSRAGLFCLLLMSVLYSQAYAQTSSPSYEVKRRETNDIAVSIVVSGLSCTCARFAEDIRNVVNDLRPNGLRVLPVLGVGGLQNLNDVLFLRGIDMGVVDEDNLRLLKQRDPRLYADIDQRVQYIAKLYNSEFHVLARKDIQSYNDLQGKKVNFNLKDSQTEVSADIIFNRLKINVERSYFDNDEAIRRLKNGELAAMIVLTGAPQAALLNLTNESELHFLPLDEQSLPGRTAEVRSVSDQYLPSELTHDEYPNLIAEGTSVPTIGNRALLVTYAWPEDSLRYNKVRRFVHEFFSKLDQFQSPARHPKWREFNAEAEVPGWTRFKPAADLIAAQREARAQSSGAGQSEDVRAQFERYVQDAAATGQKPISDDERNALFAKFQQFLATQHRQ
jgi:TRAP-type uncharacterized transport system substrate-binding protein